MTKEQKQRFLILLRKHGNISRACQWLGVDRNTYYNTLRKDPHFNINVRKVRAEYMTMVE